MRRVLNGIPALRWGRPGGRVVAGVHVQLSSKRGPIMARCGNVIAWRPAITFPCPPTAIAGTARSSPPWWPVPR